MLNTKKIDFNNLHWDKINALAKEAFPPEEYLEPEVLVKMSEDETFDFLSCLTERIL